MDGISEILATYNCVSLDEKIQFELDGVVEKEIKQAYCIENLEFCVSCMDYTTLKVSDTEESVKNFTADLLKKLKKFNLRDVAAVCVFSNYAGIVREGLKGTEIQTAVVAGNFPNSQTFTEIKLAECKMAIGAGAQEVDVVISVGDILEKNYEKVYRELKAIRKVCENVRLKVILETGELKDEALIRKASEISIKAGADFIKTSTGKVAVNATPESARIMMEVIRDMGVEKTVGFKPAGGVRTAEDAQKYLAIADELFGADWADARHYRFGASSLLASLLKALGHGDGKSASSY